MAKNIEDKDTAQKIDAQAIGFECVLGELLAVLYDTAGIEFEDNAAVLFEK